MGNELVTDNGRQLPTPKGKLQLARKVSKPKLQKGNSQTSLAGAERKVVLKLFRGLAKRSEGPTVDKATFLKFFNYPGVFGERLFTLFDQKKTGVIDEEEFLTGMISYLHADQNQKIKILFKLYDLTGDNSISVVELQTMLYSLIKIPQLIPGPAIVPHHNGGFSIGNIQKSSLESGEITLDSLGGIKEVVETTTTTTTTATTTTTTSTKKSSTKTTTSSPTTKNQCRVTCPGGHSVTIDVDQKTDQATIKDKALTEINQKLKKNGQELLDKNKFTILSEDSISGKKVRREGSIKVIHLVNTSDEPTEKSGDESIFKGDENKKNNHLSSEEKRSSLTSKGTKSAVDLEDAVQKIVDFAFEECDWNRDGKLSFAQFKKWILLSPEILDILDLSFTKFLYPTNQGNQGLTIKAPHKEGVLYRKRRIYGYANGKYVLRDNYLYVFNKIAKEKPTRIIFVEGLTVEQMDSQEDLKRGYFGFRLVTRDEKYEVYATSSDDRKQWMKILSKKSKTAPITGFYSIGKQIGQGRFASIHLGVHLKTKKEYAIKMMDKSKLKPRDLEGLRAEVAILKLVDHPNVINMRAVYDMDRYLYLVMDLVTGGDLAKVCEKGAVTEIQARHLLTQVIAGLRYLHDRGIVHRDLKPENILLNQNKDLSTSHVKITDFGLSRFAMPLEKMSATCGTMAFIAPEVFEDYGYTVAVDLWACGVLLFLLLCGWLPFFGKDPYSTMEHISKDKVEPLFNADKCFNHVTPEVKALILGLLQKKPSNRFTLEDCEQDRWFALPEKVLMEATGKAPLPVPPSGAQMPTPESSVNEQL